MEWRRKTLYEHVTERWEDLDGPYDRLQTARESVCDFYRPDYGVDYDESNDMLMLGGNIYEGTGPWVARTAAISFQGNTVSKKLDWFKYSFGNQKLDGIDELDEFCQNLKEHNSAVYQRGNFYGVQPKFTLDGWTTGSPLVFIEEDPSTGFVMCVPQHWKTYRIFYNRFNQSEGVIVKDEQWTAKKCFDKFCPGRTIDERLAKAEKVFSQALYNYIRTGRLNQKVTIWRAVFRAEDPIWEADGFVRPISTSSAPKRWFDVYLEDTSHKTQNRGQLMSSGYYSKPYVHWDYNKKIWESASRTPAFESLYDAVSMNKIFKFYLDNLARTVRPPMFAPDFLKGRMDLNDAGFTYVRTADWNYMPKPIGDVQEIRLLPETNEMFKEKQSRWFHLELFRMFTDLAQQKNTEFRVLQLAEMAGERITQLLPTIETHESYLKQVDERVRDIERQAGRGPFNRLDMENILDIIDYYLEGDLRNFEIKPEFIGTLRQAQQMQQALKPIQFGVGALGELATVMGDPNLPRFMLKGYDVADAALSAVNFPQKLIREFEDYKKQVVSFDKQVAQEKMFEKMVELMKASKSIQGAVSPDSVMAQLAAGQT